MNRNNAVTNAYTLVNVTRLKPQESHIYVMLSRMCKRENQ